MTNAPMVLTRRPVLWTRRIHNPADTATPALNPARIFAHVAFFTCLILQRFGLPFAGGSIALSLPVFALLVVWLAATGRARIPLFGALLFVLFVAATAVSTLVSLSIFNPYSGVSILSLAELLIIYTLLLFRPAEGFNTGEVQAVFLGYVRVIAVFGIIQFMMQFIGIRWFAFGSMMPALRPILIESGFNMNPLTSYGSGILRSNGFFLVEPSIFSQVLVIAIFIDYFALGRKRFLPLYAVAYMCTFSGTGLLTLVFTLILIAPLSFRNASRAGVIAATGAAAAVLFALLLPAQFQTFTSRFTSGDASGHARYVAQFSQIEAVASEGRALLGFGPGATARSIYYTPGSGNPALQLFVDYGLLGLSLFIIFIISTLWRRDQPGLTVMILLIFELGGGNLLSAPLLLLLASLTIWSEAPRLANSRSFRSRARQPTQASR